MIKYLLVALILAVTFPDLTLIRVGRDLGVKSIATGVQNDVCQNMATRQAIYQARIHQQGHQNWESRVQELYRAMPDCDSFAEVCNESWPGQDTESAAHEMYRSWKLSPGHWKASSINPVKSLAV